jgi:predicted dehydrogenase
MRRVAKAAAERGLVYMFGRQPRFLANVRAARRLVARGALGEVYHAEASWLRARWGGLSGGSWRLDRERGGGVLLDLGIHAIDEAWFCMGCPKPVEVSSGMHTAFRHFAEETAAYTADDAAAGFIRFENGATLSFVVTFALNTPGPEGLAEYANKTPEWGSTRLYGTKAGLDVKRGLLTRGNARGINVRPIAATAGTPVFTAQAREFVRAIRDGRPPLNPAEQAVMLMEVLEACRKSGDTGRSVRIR